MKLVSDTSDGSLWGEIFHVERILKKVLTPTLRNSLYSPYQAKGGYANDDNT